MLPHVDLLEPCEYILLTRTHSVGKSPNEGGSW